MNFTLNRRLLATALFALSSANAFAEREISCQATSHIVNEIRTIELRVDLPTSSSLPGYAQFIRGPGKSALSTPIYAGQRSISPSDDEEIFFWNESVTGSVDRLSQTYELELVKKHASKRDGAKWVIRGSKVATHPCEYHGHCTSERTTAFEAPVACTDSADRIVVDYDRDHEERCQADPHHCEN
jgi:hypothetical protein